MHWQHFHRCHRHRFRTSLLQNKRNFKKTDDLPLQRLEKLWHENSRRRENERPGSFVWILAPDCNPGTNFHFQLPMPATPWSCLNTLIPPVNWPPTRKSVGDGSGFNGQKNWEITLYFWKVSKRKVCVLNSTFNSPVYTITLVLSSFSESDLLSSSIVSSLGIQFPFKWRKSLLEHLDEGHPVTAGKLRSPLHVAIHFIDIVIILTELREKAKKTQS